MQNPWLVFPNNSSMFIIYGPFSLNLKCANDTIILFVKRILLIEFLRIYSSAQLVFISTRYCIIWCLPMCLRKITGTFFGHLARRYYFYNECLCHWIWNRHKYREKLRAIDPELNRSFSFLKRFLSKARKVSFYLPGLVHPFIVPRHIAPEMSRNGAFFRARRRVRSARFIF